MGEKSIIFNRFDSIRRLYNNRINFYVQ